MTPAGWVFMAVSIGYIRYLLPIAGIVWLVANILGNHILNGGE